MNTYLHGPVDCCADIAFSCRGPGPARKNTAIYQQLGGGGKGAQSCRYGNTDKSGTHIVGECELCKEERNVL